MISVFLPYRLLQTLNERVRELDWLLNVTLFWDNLIVSPGVVYFTDLVEFRVSKTVNHVSATRRTSLMFMIQDRF